jgi:AcrR family transcriptional regulator
LSNAKTQTVRRRPGRPGPEVMERDQMRDNILDVAEQLFSTAGYADTSFRDIASESAINPALITYYFGTKRALFEAVYKRRGRQLTDRWAELLDILEARPGQPPTAEELLRAFLVPHFEMKSSGPGGEAFIRLRARVHSECDELSFKLRREVYDTQAKRFIALLERALPHIDSAEVNWRFAFVIGAMLYMTSGVDRLVDLSSGRYDSDRMDEAIPRMMNFCLHGLMAPSTMVRGKQFRAKRNAGMVDGRLSAGRKPVVKPRKALSMRSTAVK